jgi:hypothetical protein
MRIYAFAIIYSLLINISFAQDNQQGYEQAFEKINCMLNGSCTASFKEAVFTVENAYFSNRLDKTLFDNKVLFLTQVAKQLIASRQLIYDFQDKAEVAKYAALFTVITDSIQIETAEGKKAYLMPFTYDFNDIWGYKQWSNMFVTKLLDTKKGNCHSMPYLYKILADEIGAKAHIAVAPNHFYIKHQSKASGWYNTELTSGIFPIDAWLMASGYIHLDAIVNKLYMEALSDKQMIALCMIDLAKGYEKKLGFLATNEFVLKCTEAALQHYPHYINAMILKAETKKKEFDGLMKKYGAKYPVDIFQINEAKALFDEMTALYSKIHELGYRKMPEEMYLDWLVSLKAERSKYENKEIANFKSQTK